MTGANEPLIQLARRYGVQTSYQDNAGQRRDAAPESLVRILQALGADLARLEDAAQALRERDQSVWRRRLEPVSLAWDGGPAEVLVRLPARQDRGQVRVLLRLEDGEEQDWTQD